MHTNYEYFINKVPEETKQIIELAIKLLSDILNQSVKYKNTEGKEIELNVDDKVILTLFSASLKIDGNIKALFKKYNISLETIGIAIDEIRVNNIEVFNPNEIFNNFYKRLLQRIMTKSKINRLEDFCAEALIGNLNYKFYCNSDIINCLFKKLNLDAENYPAFEELQTQFRSRLENTQKKDIESKPKKENLPKYISEVGTNLNAENFQTAPAYGRELETKDLMITLMTPETSAILVGEPATGKTAIVENLAYLINKGEVPNALKNKAIIKINVSSLVAGTIFRGSFEEKIERILKEAVENQNIIIFLDEMHTAIGAGSGSSTNIDLANILKPYLDRGKVKIIGATTQEEYEKFILSDEAFKRRFERIDVLEPNEKIVAEILNQRIPVLEKITGVAFPYDSMNIIELTAFLANVTTKKNRNYRDNVNNPDFAIKLLSKAFVLASYENSDIVKPEHIAESIKRSTRLNDAARNRLANLLLTKFAQSQNQYTNQCQIIEFPKRG